MGASLVEEKEDDAKDSHQSNINSVMNRWNGLSLAVKVAVLASVVLLVGVVAMSMANTGDKEVVTKEAKPAPIAETVVTTEAIGFSTDTQEDPNRLEGETTVTKAGAMGSARVTYDVYSDGRKIEVKREILKDPVTEHVLIGTKPKPITNVSWDVLRVEQFEAAPMTEKVAVAERYLNENKLKGPGLPWQDPKWLVGKIETWLSENKDSGNNYLEWEFGNRVSEWKREELARKAVTLPLGSSMDEAKALLGPPSDTRSTNLPGQSVMDYLYYGPLGDRIELIYSGGQLEGVKG